MHLQTTLVLYCTVLYRTVLSCTVLKSNVDISCMMYVCTYVCVYVCEHRVRAHACPYVRLRVIADVHTYICTSTYLVYPNVCSCTLHVCRCMSVCMYACTQVSMHACTYVLLYLTYVHIHTEVHLLSVCVVPCSYIRVCLCACV